MDLGEEKKENKMKRGEKAVGVGLDGNKKEKGRAKEECGLKW